MNTKRLSLCLLLCLVLLAGLCVSAAAEGETVKLYGRDYPLDAESVDLRSMGPGEGEANAAILALLTPPGLFNTFQPISLLPVLPLLPIIQSILNTTTPTQFLFSKTSHGSISYCL